MSHYDYNVRVLRGLCIACLYREKCGDSRCRTLGGDGGPTTMSSSSIEKVKHKPDALHKDVGNR